MKRDWVFDDVIVQSSALTVFEDTRLQPAMDYLYGVAIQFLREDENCNGGFMTQRLASPRYPYRGNPNGWL